MSNVGFDDADNELMMVLRSAAEDADVAKVRGCGGVGRPRVL